MAVDPKYFGVDDFAFPVITGGGGCDYPPENRVRAGIVYGNGVYTGTLGAVEDPPMVHSPADVLRWALIDLGQLTLPGTAEAPSKDPWQGFANREPDSPDEVVTCYDTQGIDEGREMVTDTIFAHHGVQLRTRANKSPDGYSKSEQIRKAMAEQIRRTAVTIDDAIYIIQAVVKIGQTIPLGKNVPTANGRYIFTLNVMLSLRKVQ